MSKNLIKVPKNPIADNRKFKIATEGKLKLYPHYVRRRRVGLFDPDSEAAYSIEAAFEEMAMEHIHDLQDDYWDRDY
jgi:hypothetical protein